MSVQANQRTLRRGDTGSDVRRLQGALNSQGFGPIVEDGIFGAKTEAAVMSFQRAHSLTVDGIVGPQTWARINHNSL